MRRLLVLLVLFCPTLAWADAGYAGEETLWQDTVWEGVVHIDGILTVAPGVTLEIRPGTQVLFSFLDSNGDGVGEHELFIQGRLRAIGRADAPIRFAAAGPLHRPGAWGAINLMASDDGNRLEHVIVEHAYRGFHAHFATAQLADCVFRQCVRGIQFQEAVIRLERCQLLENRNGLQFRDSQVVLRDLTVSGGYWGVRGVHSRLEAARCRVEGNLVNGINLRDTQFVISASTIAGNRRGLYLQQSQGVVAGNRIAGNSEHGILLEQSGGEVVGNRIAGNGRSGIKWVDASMTLRDNQLLGNGEYALSNDGAGAVTASGNWWGTTDPQLLARLVRDAADVEGVGTVVLEPPLPVAPSLAGLPDAMTH